MDFNSNPFATRLSGTGAVPYLYSGHFSAQTILSALNAANYRAAIVGNHGTGKTSLLLDLVPHLGKLAFVSLPRGSSLPLVAAAVEPRSSPSSSGLAAANQPGHQKPSLPFQLRWFTLRRGDPVMQSLRGDSQNWGPGEFLIIDGYEQLTWVGRFSVLVKTYFRQTGILVTSHRPTWLKTIVGTKSDIATLERLIQYVTAHHQHEISDAAMRIIRAWSQSDLNARLDRHFGNMREVLFDLYEEIEQAAKREPASRQQ